MVESNALLKRRTPKGYRGFESLPHRARPANRKLHVGSVSGVKTRVYRAYMELCVRCVVVVVVVSGEDAQAPRSTALRTTNARPIVFDFMLLIRVRHVTRLLLNTRVM